MYHKNDGVLEDNRNIPRTPCFLFGGYVSQVARSFHFILLGDMLEPPKDVRASLFLLLASLFTQPKSYFL